MALCCLLSPHNLPQFLHHPDQPPALSKGGKPPDLPRLVQQGTPKMGRAPCCDKANVKKGPWSPEEDKQLKDYIEKHGTGGNWIALPQKAGLRRCGKSCRLRWLNYLRPNIKHGDFSDEEDRIICSLFANIGSRWSIIAAQLPGRTDNDIKNYWNTKLKKKLLGLPPCHRKSHQVKKHQLEDQEQFQLPQFFHPNSVDLEGIPMVSSYFPTSFIPPLPNLIAFGGEQQNCSSAVGFESYLHGNGLESGGGGMTGCSFGEVKPAEAEACPIADLAFDGKSSSSTAAVASAGMDMGCCFRNLARAMYHC